MELTVRTSLSLNAEDANATLEPSGEYTGPESPPAVSTRSWTFEPSASIVKMALLVVALGANAEKVILVPSGDQSGSASKPVVRVVRLVWPEPSAFMT